ncbi:MAG: hypothetical protein ACI4JS_01630 [Oscillospiraceae bacterium]
MSENKTLMSDITDTTPQAAENERKFRAECIQFSTNNNLPPYVNKYFDNPEEETITNVYYNPFSKTGGQLVYTKWQYEDILAALESYKSFGLSIDEYASQYCQQERIDRGTEGFDEAAEKFRTDNGIIPIKEEPDEIVNDFLALIISVRQYYTQNNKDTLVSEIDALFNDNEEANVKEDDSEEFEL